MNRNRSLAAIWNIGIISLLILVLSSGCGQGTATPEATMPATEPAQEAESVPEISALLFQDDFQDGDSQGWVINAGWNVIQSEDKYFFGSEVTGGAYVENGGGWSDYAYHSSFRVNQGALLISINLSQSARYVLRLGGNGVYLIKEQPAETFDVLAQAGPITTGITHWVAFASQQGHVQVYVDKVLWFDVIDDAPVIGGTIAVGAQENSIVRVDNILVTRIKGELPEGTVQAPAVEATEPITAEELQIVAAIQPVAQVETEVVELPADQPPVPDGSPDLVTNAVVTLPDPIVKGREFEAVFSAVNNGNAAAGPFDVLLHFHALAGIADCTMSVAGLAPGEYAQGSCVRTINGNTGNYPVEITADTGGAVPESNEDNNMVVDIITVASGAATTTETPTEEPPTEEPPPVAGPDLVVTSIAYDSEIDGVPYYRCSYANIGNADTGAIYIEISKNGAGVYQQTGIGGLAAGQAGQWLFVNTETPPYSLTCTVDANGTIAESNEDNNAITVSFP